MNTRIEEASTPTQDRTEETVALVSKQDAMELGVSKTSLKNRFRAVDYDGPYGSSRYRVADIEEFHPGFGGRLAALNAEDEQITYSGGRDKWSAVSLDQLETLVDEETLSYFHDLGPKYRAVALRHVLRGFGLERAHRIAKKQAEEANGRAQMWEHS